MTHTIRLWLWKCLKFPFKFTVRFLNFSRKQIFGGQIFLKRGEVVYVPLWIPIVCAMLLIFSAIREDVTRLTGHLGSQISQTVHRLVYPNNGEIASFFAPSVQYWARDIQRWSDLYNVDTQLMATVMQIESCGHPTVVSSAGAQGLFQVMPFHFEAGENMIDPDTNALRGGNFLHYCYNASNGDVGLTLACYNGGPSVINRSMSLWPSETQRYYRWGVGIYSDAIVNRPQSETLNLWMNAGGSRLCTSALNNLP